MHYKHTTWILQTSFFPFWCLPFHFSFVSIFVVDMERLSKVKRNTFYLAVSNGLPLRFFFLAIWTSGSASRAPFRHLKKKLRCVILFTIAHDYSRRIKKWRVDRLNKIEVHIEQQLKTNTHTKKWTKLAPAKVTAATTTVERNNKWIWKFIPRKIANEVWIKHDFVYEQNQFWAIKIAK